jgi:hypothetical protein
MKKFKYIKSFLESSRRTDIGREIDSSSFNDIYDSLLGEAYFKFENYETWSTAYEDNMIEDDATNKILDSLTPNETFNSYEEWKESKWYKLTEFPFSEKDWAMVKADGGKDFKWHSTGHKSQEKSIFDTYLNKYGPFIVVDLTDKL